MEGSRHLPAAGAQHRLPSRCRHMTSCLSRSIVARPHRRSECVAERDDAERAGRGGHPHDTSGTTRRDSDQDPPTTSGPIRPRRARWPADSTPAGLPHAPSDREEGDAAEAIAGAEAALAHQNSASSQLDLQVISAIMNAHLKAVEGAEALITLQRETEAAVHNRSDFDTPAGARDFQRFLIGKLRDIRAVVVERRAWTTRRSQR